MHATALHQPTTTHNADIIVESIGRDWFVTLGDHMMQFNETQAKLSILKRLVAERRTGGSYVGWIDLEEALAQDDFTIPALTKFFTSRNGRRERVAMFTEMLGKDILQKSMHEWYIDTRTTSKGEPAYALRNGFQSY